MSNNHHMTSSKSPGQKSSSIDFAKYVIYKVFLHYKDIRRNEKQIFVEEEYIYV